MRETATILIVDDTESNIDILVELLGDEYDVIVAMSGERGIKIANTKKIDLILLDIVMPDMDGFETCKNLKNNEETKHIPVIFITAKTDEESIEHGYDVGGIDYVTKPFKLKELRAKVKTQIQLKFFIQHLEYISSYDQMTGIYNRRKFFEMSEKLFNAKKEDIFAVMIDIDNFKDINDKYGHPDGDKVIKAGTKTISNLLDSHSVFGRLGGEEFAIICANTSFSEVEKKVELLRAEVEKLEVIADNSDVIRFTVSCGFSKLTPDIYKIDELLKHADTALYKAKENGKNKVMFRN